MHIISDKNVLFPLRCEMSMEWIFASNNIVTATKVRFEKCHGGHGNLCEENMHFVRSSNY